MGLSLKCQFANISVRLLSDLSTIAKLDADAFNPSRGRRQRGYLISLLVGDQ